MARRRLSVLSLVATCLLPSSSADAQTVGVTTGAIAGIVTDKTGGALRGVAIVVSGDALMGTQATTTDAQGLYRFPALPSGEYALVFRQGGFAPVRREGVRVSVGFTSAIDVDLDIATVQEAVNVTHTTPLVDRHATAITTHFDADQLERLPNAGSIGAILAATPAVFIPVIDVGGSNLVPGRYSAYGTAGASRPTVEGINVAGILQTGLPLNYGAFEEVSVGTAAHSAEWPAPGVQMQFIVKSGGNRYGGAVHVDYGRHDWQSFNIDERQINRFDHYPRRLRARHAAPAGAIQRGGETAGSRADSRPALARRATAARTGASRCGPI
jgi:hypothetical protein